jgi:hypothetical protein
MLPKERQEIEIEKPHPDPLLSLHQSVTACCSHFLGTALSLNIKAGMWRNGYESNGCFANDHLHALNRGDLVG